MTPNQKVRQRFAANLRKRRLELPQVKAANGRYYPVSQAALAARVGVSVRQYSNWECGHESASLDNAEKVADYYKVSVGALCR